MTLSTALYSIGGSLIGAGGYMLFADWKDRITTQTAPITFAAGVVLITIATLTGTLK
jgi:hypothetical protein